MGGGREGAKGGERVARSLGGREGGRGAEKAAAEQSWRGAPPCQAGSAKSREPGAGGRAGDSPALPPPPQGAQQLLRKVWHRLRGAPRMGRVPLAWCLVLCCWGCVTPKGE